MSTKNTGNNKEEKLFINSIVKSVYAKPTAPTPKPEAAPTKTTPKK